MESCAAQNSTLALSTAKNSPGHQALLCRIQLFVSSFSALSSLKSYTGRQLGYHALCPWFSFQFQSCRPFSNNLFLFFLLFNRRWTHLSLVCILANAIFYILALVYIVVFWLVPYFLWWKFTGWSNESHCYPLEDRNQPLVLAFVFVCFCLSFLVFVFVFVKPVCLNSWVGLLQFLRRLMEMKRMTPGNQPVVRDDYPRFSSDCLMIALHWQRPHIEIITQHYPSKLSGLQIIPICRQNYHSSPPPSSTLTFCNTSLLDQYLHKIQTNIKSELGR